MQSQGRLPVQTPPQTRPIKRHHTARYYVHRVHESLTTRISKLICSIFLGLLFFVGLISFILWLSLRPHRPRIHIHELSLPGLAQGANGFNSVQITFNATARNSNHNIGIFYDTMQAMVYYEEQSLGATSLLFPFFQEPKNTTVLYGTLSGDAVTISNQVWMQLVNARDRGAVIFRFQITTTIRFKISTWNSKRHRMHANCEVGLGADGLILPAYKEKRCPVYFT